MLVTKSRALAPCTPLTLTPISAHTVRISRASCSGRANGHRDSSSATVDSARRNRIGGVNKQQGKAVRERRGARPHAEDLQPPEMARGTNPATTRANQITPQPAHGTGCVHHASACQSPVDVRSHLAVEPPRRHRAGPAASRAWDGRFGTTARHRRSHCSRAWCSVTCAAVPPPAPA